MLRFRWWQWLVLLLLLVAGTSWLISSRASQPSSPSSASLLRLEFRAPGASIEVLELRAPEPGALPVKLHAGTAELRPDVDYEILGE